MKNYLLMADENLIQSLSAIIPSLQFVEVKGMNIKEFANDTFLTTTRVEPAATTDESPAIIEEVKELVIE